MACAWRMHGMCMACAWRMHGMCTVRACGECMYMESCLPPPHLFALPHPYQVWARGSRAAKRDEIKRALHEAYATAKELGEEVAVTRRSVGELRQALAAGGSGGGGGDAAAAEEEAAGSLRLRLQLDTAAYKDAVALLRELKPQIGGLQQQMQRIQQQLEADFAAWHACAVAAAAG